VVEKEGGREVEGVVGGESVRESERKRGQEREGESSVFLALGVAPADRA
jgi:hypothetical protein